MLEPHHMKHTVKKKVKWRSQFSISLEILFEMGNEHKALGTRDVLGMLSKCNQGLELASPVLRP